MIATNTTPPAAPAVADDPLPGSPLSAEAKDLFRQYKAWDEREKNLQEQRRQLLVALVAATRKYEEALAGLAETGEITQTTQRQAKRETGLQEAEEQLAAVETVLRGVPEIKNRAMEKFWKARERERREALERLDRELRALVRKEVLPHLRALRPHLPAVERIAAEARRWSRESRNPDFIGLPFPVALGSVRAFVQYVSQVFYSEIEAAPNGRAK